MIVAKQVSKRYGRALVVDSVSFEVAKGDVFGLVGPNGAGKSTVLSMVTTVLRPTSGDILVSGCSVTREADKIRSMVGYVPQEIALYHSLSVRDNLRFWGRVSGGKLTASRLSLVSSILGLDDWHGHKVSRLSGGLKRRLNIAVALLHDPQILIMDEPTLGVDIKTKRVIAGFIRQMAAEGKTVVYTSHDIQEIQYLCNKIAILNNGGLLFAGTLAEARLKAKEECAAISDDSSLEEVLGYLGEWG